MSNKNEIWQDCAVSETVGFIIIFGIALTGIGLVTLYGYPALLQEQSNANIKNMEKNLIILQNDINSLTFKNTPYQETSMIVTGGTLFIKNETAALTPAFTLKITGQPPDRVYKTGKFWYDSQDGTETITLENGAVHVRSWSSNGSAMISYPRWFYDSVNSTYVLHFIRITPAECYLAQTGIGTVKMQLSSSSQDSWNITSSHPVTISYTPSNEQNYKVAWRNYFAQPDLQMTYISSDPITYQLSTGAKTLIVKQYNITVLSI